MLDSRITQRRPSPPSTGGRDRPEWVVAIRRNGWSRSIGIAGRDQPVRAYGAQRALLDGLGTRYRVVQVDLGPMRRFHPKAFLLSNRQRAICAIGSGNLTHGGMSANHEVWTFGASDGQGAGLLAGLRDYIRMLLELLPLADPLRDSIDSVFDEQQAWVASLPPGSGLVMSRDGTGCNHPEYQSGDRHRAP